MRAKNVAGWGEFSEVATIRAIDVPPKMDPVGPSVGPAWSPMSSKNDPISLIHTLRAAWNAPAAEDDNPVLSYTIKYQLASGEIF